MVKRDFHQEGDNILYVRGEQVSKVNASSPVTKLPSVSQSRLGKRSKRERSATHIKNTSHVLEPS